MWHQVCGEPVSYSGGVCRLAASEGGDQALQTQRKRRPTGTKILTVAKHKNTPFRIQVSS